MSKDTRPAACSVTNKRLRHKSWYYRDGKYFYSKKVWSNEREKLAAEAEKTKAEKAAKAAEAKAAEVKAKAEAAPAAEEAKTPEKPAAS